MPHEHLSTQYDQDLEAIRSKVLMMGGLVENQFYDALAAFRSGDAAQAEKVIKADEAVNRLEVAIDDDCSHLIVRRQPAANDLRTVMSTIKLITDLERVGDESVKIARVAQAMNLRTAATITHYESVRAMAAKASEMLRAALDALARLDEKQAEKIIADDRAIDHDFRVIMRGMITYMMEDPRTISLALDTIWVSKAIERVGDHAKNIAEYVIYMVRGEDIRHTGTAALAGTNQ
jgi:phosphate transport system protein